MLIIVALINMDANANAKAKSKLNLSPHQEAAIEGYIRSMGLRDRNRLHVLVMIDLICDKYKIPKNADVLMLIDKLIRSYSNIDFSMHPMHLRILCKDVLLNHEHFELLIEHGYESDIDIYTRPCRYDRIIERILRYRLNPDRLPARYKPIYVNALRIREAIMEELDLYDLPRMDYHIKNMMRQYVYLNDPDLEETFIVDIRAYMQILLYRIKQVRLIAKFIYKRIRVPPNYHLALIRRLIIRFGNMPGTVGMVDMEKYIEDNRMDLTVEIVKWGSKIEKRLDQRMHEYVGSLRG